ncbi:MAG: DUF1559 domain-containing protein [Planctomycetaceae bacterium]|nr:DUF1559 domain-containing protein [Planctomycetaceae bacterium]
MKSYASVFRGNFSKMLWAMKLFVVLSVGVGIETRQCHAQSDPGPANIGFHAEPSRIRDSNFYKAIQLEQTLDPMSKLLWQAAKVKGVVALPGSFEDFLEVGPGDPPPFHFRIEFEFKTDKQMEAVKEQLNSMTDDVEEKNDGVTYYYPRGAEGMYLATTKDRRFVLSTDGFPLESGKFPKMTDVAEQLLKETAKSPAGVAIDIRSAAKLIASGVEFGQENFPPQAKAYLDLPEQMNSIRADLTLVPQTEAKAVIDCRDEEAAKFVLETIDGLVAMGKTFAAGNGPDIEIQKKLLAGIKTKAEGKQVLVTMLVPLDVFAKLREQAEEVTVMNDVKQVALSMHNYYEVNRRFPFHAGPDESDDISWRVRVLPYLDQNNLFQQFDLTQPWDSEANRKFSEVVVATYGDSNQTGLQWVQSDVRDFRDITDGTSNTIAFVHNAPGVVWTENKPFTHDDAVKMFKALKPGETMVIGMYDGSVTRIDNKMKLETFEAMLTPDGGEAIER